MGDALLQTVFESVSRYSPEPWRPAILTEKERSILHRECTQESEFDELNSRATFYELFRTGDLKPVIRQTAHGKVIALLAHEEQEREIPWALWSRILRGFAPSAGGFYTIFLCAHPALRTFPAHLNSPIRPLHINGGYTYPCDKSCVFIYRAEDATRVLIHELLHAACTDNKAVHLEQMEAETEAWAELFWCALLSSKGDLKGFKSLVVMQSRWMAAQNRRLVEGGHIAPGPQQFPLYPTTSELWDPKSRVENHGSPPFPWRYTLGKTDMWRRWGIYRPGGGVSIGAMKSLRLTVPPPPAVKREFGVPATSVFL